MLSPDFKIGALPCIVHETFDVSCTNIETVSIARRPSDSSLSVKGTSAFPAWDSGMITEHHAIEDAAG